MEAMSTAPIPAAWATLLAALVTAVGIVIAALASIYLWRYRVRAEKEIEREMELRRREDRVRGLLVALRREITVNVAPLGLQFDPAMIAATRARFVAQLSRPPEADPSREVPQGEAIETLVTFDDLKEDLDLLPVEVVDGVISFLDHDRRLTRLVKAFSSGLYDKLSNERQVEAVDGLIGLGTANLAAALTAKRAIDDHLAAKHGLARQWTPTDSALWQRLDKNDDRTAHGRSPDPDKI
jgi:hypothetical protein